MVPPQATYEFGSSVPASIQQLVGRALGFAGGYVRARLGKDLPPVNVYVYTDLDQIAAAWSRVQGGSIDDARRLWPSTLTSVQAYGPPGRIWVYAVGFGFDANLAKIVIHEAFHNLQHVLVGGRNISDTGVSPAWLTEGIAEYIAYRTTTEYRLDSAETVRQMRIARVKNVGVPLRALETYTGFAPQNAPYPLSALAADRLAETGGETALVAYFEAIGRGMAWADAFRSAFGRAVETFYDEFETYRRGL